jgi:riboflavin kinase/FMN adenylyltransferase
MNAAVVTIGTFDGVHLGHQAVLGRVARLCREKQLSSIAYTFPSSPQQKRAHLLLPSHFKIKLLREYVDQVKIIDFQRIRYLAPAQFLGQIIKKELEAQIIIVGEGFRFGHDRSGDIPFLKGWGKEQGLTVIEVPLVTVDSCPVSSTRIRELMLMGKVREASTLLGRPPLLYGRVVRGDGLGRRIGYPTANLSIDETILIPKKGIYLVDAFCGEIKSAGLLYIGARPSLKEGELRLEVHLLSPPDVGLYGNNMEVQLLRRLRGDQPFPTLEALSRQIGKDILKARSLKQWKS